jgi:hypothetical protein
VQPLQSSPEARSQAAALQQHCLESAPMKNLPEYEVAPLRPAVFDDSRH